MTPDDAWELIEQDLIPSARKSTYTEFRELLARIWDEGFAGGISYYASTEDGDDPSPDNPYRASED